MSIFNHNPPPKKQTSLDTVYVVSAPVTFTLYADNWDSTNYKLTCTGYTIGANGVQVGLPPNDSTSNTQRVIESALTIPQTAITSPNIENNTAGYVTLILSAVNPPKEDIKVAIFGLAEAAQVKVTQTAIEGVTPPVTGQYRTTKIDNTQYTGTIAWSPSDSPFKASTTYTATITLTAKPGYTFTGITSNFFTLSGAKSVKNNASSGVVTVVFPATAST